MCSVRSCKWLGRPYDRIFLFHASHLVKNQKEEWDFSKTLPCALLRKSICLRAGRSIRPVLISGFCSMRHLGVFLLLPGWDASPSQGYPQHFQRCLSPPRCLNGYHETESVLPKNTTQCPRPGPEPGPLNPESSTQIMIMIASHSW